jgi:hypothetical protein
MPCVARYARRGGLLRFGMLLIALAPRLLATRRGWVQNVIPQDAGS